MKHTPWIGLILIVLVTLTSCLPTEDNRDTTRATQASLTIGVDINDPRLTGSRTSGARALNPAPPAAITRIIIRVFSPDQELASGDILAAGGRLSITVPPGIPLTLNGTAYADQELRYQGEAKVQPLLPGLGASVRLNLESVNGPDFSLPIQIDITAAGMQANAASSAPVFSENNRNVLFRSLANNLNENDTNQAADLFVKDLHNGTLNPVHTDSTGKFADRAAGAADMTPDGQIIVFDSAATNLDASLPDTNNFRDVFLKDLTTQRVTRLSRAAGETSVQGDSTTPSISDDGRLVVFESTADLLGTGQTGIFRVDTTNGAIQFIAPGQAPRLSGDGSTVLWYDSSAQTLRRRDLRTGATTTVLVPFIVDESAPARHYDISRDGRFVVFAVTTAAGARALSFSPGVYLLDRDATPNAPRLVSTNSDTQALSDDSGAPGQPSLSDDGRFIAFALGTRLYVKDTQDGALAALTTAGTAPTLSADGSLLAFAAGANENLYVLRNPLFNSSKPSGGAVTFTLRVGAEGDGHGLISSDTGLDCGNTCNQTLTGGTLVQLDAVPDERSEFAGWFGDCASTAPRSTLTLTADSTCTARFVLKEFPVQITIRGGPNAGSVVSDAGADATAAILSCHNRAERETVCSQNFRAGTALLLKPTAAGNNNTVAWLGCDSDAGLDGCRLVVNTGRRVTTTFGTSSFLLTVKHQGNGVVTSEDGGINCGTQCERTYINNTRVNLVATAANDSHFTGWSGDCSGANSTAAINVRAVTSCTALFELNNYPLTVRREGNGSGTVTSADSRIDCGTRCSNDYTAHTQVELRAVSANEDSLFVGWNGACTGSTTPVHVIMDEARTCTATFARRTVILSVSTNGSGSGTITSTPAGIDCGTVCERSFDVRTSVRLRATAAAGSVLSGWSGACSGSDRDAALTLNAAASCIATFTRRATLTVTVDGSGVVVSDPVGINCGTDCTQAFDDAPTITLRANPAAGFVFGGWTGACTGTDPSTNVLVDTAKTCNARFVRPATLRVTLTGEGTVTSDPAGINCGSDCEQTYDNAPTVSLRAEPAAGFAFIRWGGACSGTDVTTSVAVGAAKVCSATFTRRATLTVSVAGNGTVSSEPAGINCGTDCDQAFDGAPNVTLRAEPAAGFTFERWGEACTGTNTTTTVVVNSAKTCVATFIQRATLRVTKTGEGIVTSDPDGINCGADCEETYTNAPTITLRADPATGFVFTGWSGACDGTQANANVVVDTTKTCNANFVQRTTLTVQSRGNGTITSDPPGIDCGNDCTETYERAPTVTLRAAPAADWIFSGWDGDCRGNASTTTVSMITDRQCTAVFEQRILFALLTVRRDGGGEGTVSGNGIDCGTDCQESLQQGTVVTLQARAQAGSVFRGWSGDCQGSPNGATVTMNSDAVCTATFARLTTLSVNFDGAGSGRVTLEPGDRSCTSNCEVDFDLNEQVQLTATPDNNTVFRGWSGDCATAAGTTTTASVRMESNKSCTARFAARFTLTVRKEGGGDGVITSEDQQVVCGDLCTATYEEGTLVQLTVDPTSGTFTGWGGDCSDTDSTMSVIMDANRTCVATIRADVTLSISVLGEGTVISRDDAINCGSRCEAIYAPGTSVTLEAQAPASSGIEFRRWIGDCSGTSPILSFTIDQSMKCEATFARRPIIPDPGPIIITPL